MSKLGIIVDGAASLLKDEYKKYDISRIYLRINDMKNNIEYKDDENFPLNEIKKGFDENNIFKTSCTPIGEIYDLCEQLLKKYDEVIIFTIHKSISSQFDNCEMVAKDFDGKVHVVKANNMNWEIAYFAKKARKMSKNGMSAPEIVNWINNESEKTATIFTCSTWKGMTVGGRFSKMLSSILNKIKVYPIICLQHEKPEFYGLVKDYDKAIQKMVSRFMKENELKSVNEIDQVIFYSTLLDKEKEDFFVEWLAKKFNRDVKDIIISQNAIAVCVHTGPNAYGIALKIKEKK